MVLLSDERGVFSSATAIAVMVALGGLFLIASLTADDTPLAFEPGDTVCMKMDGREGRVIGASGGTYSVRFAVTSADKPPGEDGQKECRPYTTFDDIRPHEVTECTN